MSDTDSEVIERVELAVTNKALAMAVAHILIEHLPIEVGSGIDADEVALAKANIEKAAADRDIPPSKAALTVLVKAFQGLLGESFVRIPQLETDRLASLKLTPELVDQGVESVAEDNYDETDAILTRAARKIIDLEKGVGPTPGTTRWEWVSQTFGVAISNAVGFAGHLSSLLEGDDMEDKRNKLMAHIAKSAFSLAPDKVREMMTPAMKMLGNNEALLFMWGLFNEGVVYGMFMGWRCHELALLGQQEASNEVSPVPEENV